MLLEFKDWSDEPYYYIRPGEPDQPCESCTELAKGVFKRRSRLRLTKKTLIVIKLGDISNTSPCPHCRFFANLGTIANDAMQSHWEESNRSSANTEPGRLYIRSAPMDRNRAHSICNVF